MAKEGSSVVLLSIRPPYVRAILSGQKKVEFRKQRFARPIQFVVIYATSPIGKVVGYFKIDQIDEGKPDEIWQRYHEVGGIPRSTYQSYYRLANKAVAIGIRDLTTLQSPLPLKAILGSGTSPPQSYYYLSDTVLDHLRSSDMPGGNS